MSDFTDRALGLVMARHDPGIAMGPPGPSGRQDPQRVITSRCGPNAIPMVRPYSGLETQAPYRASKGEGLFSAVVGTLQHPL